MNMLVVTNRYIRLLPPTPMLFCVCATDNINFSLAKCCRFQLARLQLTALQCEYGLVLLLASVK